MDVDFYVGGVCIKKEKGNEIIKEIVSCLRNKGVTYGQALFLLEEAKEELSKTMLT